jgi:hypothetical protein
MDDSHFFYIFLWMIAILTTNKASQTRWPCDKTLNPKPIYLLRPHSEHQKNLFQSKQSKHFHQRNRFT